MTHAVKDIRKTLEDITKKVDPAICELLSCSVDEKYQDLAKYQMSCGGKRLRPALAIISCELLGGKAKDALYSAASLEILHNSTLIIDDIIDHSDSRRNKPTVWKEFGTSMAECFSMGYVASIFQGANKSPERSELTEVLAKALKTVINGEVEDILFERSGREDEPFVVENRYPTVSKKDYFSMIEKKTAVLIQASCQVGGICAGGSKEQIDALMDYGWGIGVSFQLRDDILDIFGDEKSFGKKIGKDIIEKKMGNIVVILALEELGAEDKDTILNILNSSEAVKDDDVSEAIRIIKKTGAKDRASELSKKYVDDALKSLQKLPQNESNQSLQDLAEFIIERKH